MAMIEIVGIVLFVAILISNRSLASRISILEAKVKNGVVPATNSMPAAAPVVEQTLTNGGMEEYVAPAAAAYTTTAPAEPDPSERSGAWLKEDWLMKVGAFIFILGLGWFVSYAFANNWIGPVGRISMGIIAGVLVMAFAFWRMMRFPQQGGVFMALGAGMTILSIFAGRSVYGFFTPASAIIFDFIIAAFVSFASYKFNLRSLAVASQVLAFAAPLLVAGQTDSIFLFSYLLVISIATLALAGLMAWRGLILTSLIFVGLYSLPYIVAAQGGTGMYSVDAPIILNFAYIFATLYLLSGMFAVVRGGVKEVQNELVLALLNGIFLFLWIYNVPAKEWQMLLFATWAIVFAAATAAQLNGAALTIAFTIEVSLLVAIVLALTKDVKAATATSILFVAPVFLSFASMTNYLMAREVFTRDTFVLLVLAFSLIVAGRLILSGEREMLGKESNNVSVILIIFGTMYIWFVIWCFLHILMPEAPDMATFGALTIYTIAGLWAYCASLAGGDTARRVYGAGLLIFVVFRLLFVDVWSMALSGRVITFFVIGILLMSTAFLTKRKSASKQIV